MRAPSCSWPRSCWWSRGRGLSGGWCFGGFGFVVSNFFASLAAFFLQSAANVGGIFLVKFGAVAVLISAEAAVFALAGILRVVSANAVAFRVGSGSRRVTILAASLRASGSTLVSLVDQPEFLIKYDF